VDDVKTLVPIVIESITFLNRTGQIRHCTQLTEIFETFQYNLVLLEPLTR
jgi:hypothetical protein